MFERSERVPMSKQAGGNGDDESRNPGGKWPACGSWDERSLKTLGSSPSRDMENQTRDWPSW